MQPGAVFPEPGFSLVYPRAGFTYMGPERLPVVHLAQMRNLVGGEIIEHVWRGKDQTPGKIQYT